MTRLRQMMLDELQCCNYSPGTMRSYIRAVQEFARFFGRSTYRLGPDHVRQYQAHLFRHCKLLARTIQTQTAVLRFLYVKTLRRPYPHEYVPFPRRPLPLPTILSPGGDRTADRVGEDASEVESLGRQWSFLELPGLRFRPRALKHRNELMQRWADFLDSELKKETLTNSHSVIHASSRDAQWIKNNTRWFDFRYLRTPSLHIDK